MHILVALTKLRKRLLASSYLSVHPSVHPSVRTEQHGSHRMNFHEILYLTIFRKSVGNNQASLKSDKNNGYFTRIPVYIHDGISRWILLRMRNVSEKNCKSENTLYVQQICPKNRAFYEICGKIRCSQTGQKWYHNTAHALCMSEK
jgi:hypothetical protein